MPEGLAAAMNDEQRQDLVAFLTDLGRHDKLRLAIAESVLEHAQAHDAATFEFERGPLDVAAWPSWEAHVNRDRLYDFYSKQAAHFRRVDNPPDLLEKNPGLDGGKYGHWGNQNEAAWVGNEWNSVVPGLVTLKRSPPPAGCKSTVRQSEGRWTNCSRNSSVAQICPGSTTGSTRTAHSSAVPPTTLR